MKCRPDCMYCKSSGKAVRMREAAGEMHALLRDFLDNYEFGDEVDNKIRALLAPIDGNERVGNA